MSASNRHEVIGDVYGSIEHSAIIRAFTRNVPDCYVRDYRNYRGKFGWLNICRGYRETTDYSTGHTFVVPAQTLCVIPRGNVTASELYRGVELVRPGWRVQMRKAGEYLTAIQKDRIENDLRQRVFGRP